MSIRLFVVLSIFSSEKPARSYCQDLIKDLKAVVLTGCVSLWSIVIDHATDKHEKIDTPQGECQGFEQSVG